jgi:hypothetical protein
VTIQEEINSFHGTIKHAFEQQTNGLAKVCMADKNNAVM